MNENSIVKLLEDYVLFQEDEYVCIYQKSTKLVVLKLKAGKNAYTEAVKDDLSRPHQLKWLAKQPYWKWFGLVALKYPEFFEEMNESKAEKYVRKADYFTVVNREHFAENYQLDCKFEKIRIFLWGASALNKLLYDEIRDKVVDLYLIKNESDENDENSFLTLSGEKELENNIEKNRILLQDDLMQMDIRRADLFLVDATGVSEERLLEINEYVVRKDAVALFYSNSFKTAVIGPLVVGGESACIHCMQNQGLLKKYYAGGNGFLDQTFSHLFIFFVMRILYYIKGTNLYYLLSDAQIPINKIITITKDNIVAKMKYLYRDVDCICYK